MENDFPSGTLCILKAFGHMSQGNQQLKFEEIHAIASEIIDATDGRRRNNWWLAL